MSETERDKWERRYSEGEYRPRSFHAPFLDEWLPRIRLGRALDVACGAGRNALRLAEVGFDVEAVDISTTAIEMARTEAERRGLAVEWRVADLDHLDLPDAGYDLITVIRYRNRSLWPRLVGALAPGGWVLVEHHLRTHLDVDGPASPEFKLEPGELLEAFSGLRIVHYSESLETGDSAESRYLIARMAACHGDPGW